MPLKSIEAQLRDVLQVPGIEDELEKWRSIPRQPGVLQDNFDGAICQSLPSWTRRPALLRESFAAAGRGGAPYRANFGG